MTNVLVKALCERWRLTNRETQLLDLVTRGVTATKDLAEAMTCSLSAVEKHVEGVSRKSGLAGRSEIISFLLGELAELVSVLDNRRGISLDGMSALVIEDDEFIAEHLALILSGAGFSLERSARLTEPLIARMQGQELDVVLLDYVIPAPDGLAVAGMLRDFGIAAPSAVMFTGYPERLDDAGGADTVHVLLKPIEAPELIRTTTMAAVATRIRRHLWRRLFRG